MRIQFSTKIIILKNKIKWWSSEKKNYSFEKSSRIKWKLLRDKPSPRRTNDDEHKFIKSHESKVKKDHRSLATKDLNGESC